MTETGEHGYKRVPNSLARKITKEELFFNLKEDRLKGTWLYPVLDHAGHCINGASIMASNKEGDKGGFCLSLAFKILDIRYFLAF